MTPIDLSEATFDRTIAEADIILVDFWAAWCPPCLQFAPIFEAAAVSNPGIAFAKVNTEAEGHLAWSSNITSIPPLMAFRNGILVFEEAGALSAAGLASVIEVVRDLDMGAVKAETTASWLCRSARGW
jgi:thioredoxin 1